MTFLKAISDNRVSVALASGPTGSWRYACAAFVGDFSSGREFLRLTSAKIEFDVPSFPLDVAYRFVSNHEAAHCLSGVSREHVRSARTLNHRDRDSVAELVFHTRHEESIADAFAILAEIRRGTDRETLSKIADARYAALSSRAHDATRGFTHDTGPAISSILADYDRLSKDPFFLRATTADLMKRATAYAENNRLSRDEIAAAIENSAKIRRVVENGGFSAGDADPRGTIANVVAAHARLEESARRERSQAAQIAETAASAGNSASLETRNDIDAWFAGAEKTTATLPSP
ncbi:MAG: hypothetical protein ING19_20665 [Azospirillum sp.]|nr:hypothetical protein [Azospirillum sp.]